MNAFIPTVIASLISLWPFQHFVAWQVHNNQMNRIFSPFNISFQKVFKWSTLATRISQVEYLNLKKLNHTFWVILVCVTSLTKSDLWSSDIGIIRILNTLQTSRVWYPSWFYKLSAILSYWCGWSKILFVLVIEQFDTMSW